MKGKVFRTSLLVVLGVSACTVAAAQTLFDDFDTDPISTRFTVNGPNTSEDSEGAPVPTFSWQDGAIVANYHSEQPATRLEAPLPVTVDETDKFRFGATFTIRSDGLFVNDAESFGFQFATFALLDSSLTGTDRFVDAYSNVEFDYFPQDSPWFDTVSLGPAVISGKTTQDNFFSRVFFDFGPNTTLNDERSAARHAVTCSDRVRRHKSDQPDRAHNGEHCYRDRSRPAPGRRADIRPEHGAVHRFRHLLRRVLMRHVRHRQL